MLPRANSRISFNTKLLLNAVLLLVVSALLISCQPVKEAKVYTPPSFKEFPQYNLDVVSIKIVEDYVSPGKAPNVEHLFPLTPANGIKIWANDRFRAAGTTRALEVVISDARVTSSALPVTEGVKGLFYNDQAEQIEGKLAVTLKIYGSSSALAQSEINVTVSKTRTIPESASVETREVVYDTLTKELLQALNAEMDKQIPIYFAKYRL